MRKKTGDYEVPFDKDGNQLVDDYPVSDRKWDLASKRHITTLRSGHSMQPNGEFSDTLTFKRLWASGRHFAFSRSNGKGVVFMPSEFEKMVPHMMKGEVKGIFTFVKRGTAYGCKLVEAED